MRRLICDILWWAFTGFVGLLWLSLLAYWLHIYT